jgi:hypothetical protein
MSLLKSVSDIWKNTPALYNKVPFDRVFVGRVPSTKLYRFPYVEILASQGRQTYRTDKTRAGHGPLSFHIWVDDAELEFAESVALAITNSYADRCWALSSGARVLDCLDEGEPMARQTDMPNVKAWEVVKLFTVLVERDRPDREDECCNDLPSPPSDESEPYSESSPAQESSSS